MVALPQENNSYYKDDNSVGQGGEFQEQDGSYKGEQKNAFDQAGGARQESYSNATFPPMEDAIGMHFQQKELEQAVLNTLDVEDPAKVEILPRSGNQQASK